MSNSSSGSSGNSIDYDMDNDSLKVSSSSNQHEDDMYSVGSYSTVHTFQSSQSGGLLPLRKETPSMKKKTGQRRVSSDTASVTGISAKTSVSGQDEMSECSEFSTSVHTFTSFDQVGVKPSRSTVDDDDNDEAGDEVRSALNIVKKNHPNNGRSDSSYSKVNNFNMQRSSSLYSLSHATGSNVAKLYMTNSVHENMALHVRCGFAQKQNNRKYMEDYITVCPSVQAKLAASIDKQISGDAGLTSETDDHLVDAKPEDIVDDFSFFGVYDGHDGSYVSQYLQDHLMKYFQEKLLASKAQSASCDTLSPKSLKREELYKQFNLNKWGASFLEAASKTDREILLYDSKRLDDIAERRDAAFHKGESSNESPSSGCDSDKHENREPNASFGGSTAAVVIVYRDHQPSDFPYVEDSSKISPSTVDLNNVNCRPPIPPKSGMEKQKEKENDDSLEKQDTNVSMPESGDIQNQKSKDNDEEGDYQFHDDVVVGVFAKRDSSASVSMVPDEPSESDSEEKGPIDIIGPCPGPEPARLTLQERKKKMQRYSSVDSAYDAPATLLNLDDEHVFDALENINNKQTLPFGMMPFKRNPFKRDSNTSNISDLTQSYGNMSFLNSSEDILHNQHSQPFNPKQKSLAAAVRRSYEENSVEDFSVYEASQLEEMVDDFLQRASMLDKAANDCRGQAAELLQVLQQRVRSSNVSYSNSNSKSRSNSGVSSASPYMSSLDASNSHSAHSGRSGRSMNSITDDVSDISQATGLASLKTNSSLGSLTSLKSFEDEPIKTKGMSVKHLSTVSECLFESRATSFAASRQTSLNSHGSKTGSIFNENLRLALMGEIANKNIKILVAHAGDCRVVLCDGGQAVQVTLDHTPLLDVEKFRIKSSGGFVSNKRVNGILAVSRSFGDIKFKSFNKQLKIPDSAIDESRLPEGIWSNSNQVISMPEVVELEVLSTYEFVVIASDCVWETLTCKEVISFVRMQLLEHGDSMKAAEALASKVTDDGGTDNCSIIIVNLNQT